MFFKRLSIDGFKSFGQKTEIQFAPGVSVIVGPNGCGKSNVFDSIKWVLGEQSAKSLRGGRMSDVVFNGTSSRKAAAFSEVTLELSNETGFLPTDERSVVVTRRLARTGESAYLINGEPCRLMDIQRLMLGAGIASNSFAIMQQGKVDRVIHSKPGERRHIIEEAAGISKYKAQKEEAERRLARSDEDLNRVNDLLAEVRRNTTKLRKQSERAREHQKLTSELKKREMVLLAVRHAEAEAERQQLEVLCSELSDRLLDFDDEIERLAEQNESSRGELEAMAARYEAMQKDRDDLLREKAEASSRLASLTERLQAADKARERLAADIEAQSGLGDSREEERANLEFEINDIQVTLREKGFQLERRQAQIDAVKEGMGDQEQELVGLRESLEALSADKAELEGEIRFAKQMLEKLGDAKADGEEVVALRKDSAEATAKAEEAKQAVFRLQEEMERGQSDLDDKRRSLAQATEQIKKVGEKREEALNALRAARSRLGALQQLQENYDGFARGVKEVMLASDDAKLRGVVGVAASLMRPHKGMESAIEVALGGALQHVVVETSADGKEAIELLKRKNAGRCSFIPLDIIQGRDNDSRYNALLKLPGVVGWATDLVDFDPFVQNAVRHLLGGTIVVEHIDVALALERKGFRTKYVTLDGDILSPGGLMTGGSYKTSGLMTRESEIQNLGESSETLARQLVGMDEHLDKLESSAGHLRVSVQELEQGSTRRQIALVAAIKDAEARDKEAKQLADRYEKLSEVSAAAEDERTNYEDQVRLNGSAVEDLAKEIAALKKRSEELSGQQSERTKRLGASMDEVQNLKLELTREKERCAGLQRALEKLGEDASRDGASLGERVAELERLGAEVATLATEKAEAEARLAAVEAKLAEAEARLKAETADKHGRAEQQRQIAERLQTIQRDRNELQNELQEARVRGAQRDERLESLTAQAVEKFSASMDDIVAQLEAELAEMAAGRAVAKAVEEARPAARVVEIETHVSVDLEIDVAIAAATEASEGPRVDNDELAPMDDQARERWLDHPLAQLPADTLQADAKELRAKLESLGVVNLEAIEEHARAAERQAFIEAQKKDLDDARRAIVQTVAKIEETTGRMFRDCFDAVRENFVQLFRRLFNGGKADLVLTEPEDIQNSGVEIIAQPPGKKPQTISLLSGGEMCMTATALLFALFQWKPSPFCVLDEIDAPLDDANVERFKAMIREFADATQFVVISHNKLTMELADSIFGVTMQEPGVSKIVSVRFDQLDETDLLRDAPAGGQVRPIDDRSSEGGADDAPEPAQAAG
jgi:chromosome segregation protein